jgi:hypothetical protein
MSEVVLYPAGLLVVSIYVQVMLRDRLPWHWFGLCLVGIGAIFYAIWRVTGLRSVPSQTFRARARRATSVAS